MKILIPLPRFDFDPTEVAIPWALVTKAGHEVRFSTPDGKPGEADPRMTTGEGLGILKRPLMADQLALKAYRDLVNDPAFHEPASYAELAPDDIDGMILPGGHAPGMKEYLESETLQRLVCEIFESGKPTGAICHGVLLAARCISNKTGRSILHGRKTTALTKALELSGWALTCLWLGDYYRTYPVTVQEEVTAALAAPDDFVPGPKPVLRDRPGKLSRGFVVRDGNYISARWPGDAHRFATAFIQLLDEHRGQARG